MNACLVLEFLDFLSFNEEQCSFCKALEELVIPGGRSMPRLGFWCAWSLDACDQPKDVHAVYSARKKRRREASQRSDRNANLVLSFLSEVGMARSWRWLHAARTLPCSKVSDENHKIEHWKTFVLARGIQFLHTELHGISRSNYQLLDPSRKQTRQRKQRDYGDPLEVSGAMKCYRVLETEKHETEYDL